MCSQNIWLYFNKYKIGYQKNCLPVDIPHNGIENTFVFSSVDNDEEKGKCCSSVKENVNRCCHRFFLL